MGNNDMGEYSILPDLELLNPGRIENRQYISDGCPNLAAKVHQRDQQPENIGLHRIRDPVWQVPQNRNRGRSLVSGAIPKTQTDQRDFPILPAASSMVQ